MNVANLMAMTQHVIPSANELISNNKIGNQFQKGQSFMTYLGHYAMDQSASSPQSGETLNELKNNLQSLLSSLVTSDELEFEDVELLLTSIFKKLEEMEHDEDHEYLAQLLEELNILEIDDRIKSILNEFIEFKLSSFELDQPSIPPFVSMEPFNIVKMDKELSVEKLQKLTEQLHLLFKDLNESNVKQTAPHLLPILAQLSQVITEVNREEVMKQLNEELSKQDLDLLKRLLTSFQNRDQLIRSGAYEHEANVTVKDVAKWLDEAFNNQNIKIEQPIPVPVGITSDHIPMTQAEQYMIHLNESDRVERIQEQLMRQFKTVINQSRFIKAPELTQLSITLTPSHLGNVHVQFVEMNGDMTVKMIASSLAAKQLLEANIHQLKHLFAPHNIIIERSDSELEEIDQLDEQLDEQEEQSMREEEREKGHHSGKDDSDDQTIEHFQSVLTAINDRLEGKEFENG